MTSTNTLSPSDTGEIETGGVTVRLSEYATHLPPTPFLRRADATGEIVMPRNLPVPGDQVQPIFPLKRVIDPVRDEVEEDLLRRSVPFVFPEGYVYRGRTGRHRPPTAWARLVAFVARLVKP